MKVLETKVATFPDERLLKASLTLSQASHQSLGKEEKDRETPTPKLEGASNRGSNSKRGVLEIKMSSL